MDTLEYLETEIERLENEKFMCMSFREMFARRKKVIELENIIVQLKKETPTEKIVREELMRER